MANLETEGGGGLVMMAVQGLMGIVLAGLGYVIKTNDRKREELDGRLREVENDQSSIEDLRGRHEALAGRMEQLEGRHNELSEAAGGAETLRTRMARVHEAVNCIGRIEEWKLLRERQDEVERAALAAATQAIKAELLRLWADVDAHSVKLARMEGKEGACRGGSRTRSPQVVVVKAGGAAKQARRRAGPKTKKKK